MSPAFVNDTNLDDSRKCCIVPLFAKNNNNLSGLRKDSINGLPDWLKQEIPDSVALEQARILSRFGVRTVCQEAKCPNISYCFRHLEFTFLVLGGVCSRNCRFCAVKKCSHGNLELDLDEPMRIAKAVKELGLEYVVITSVSRDDLDDGGAEIFARTIRLIRKIGCDIKVEVLIPDFQGKASSLKCVLDVSPCVAAHNIETVERLYKKLRPEADYWLSLGVLNKIKEIQPLAITKSSLMLGLGEREAEVVETMKELRSHQCDILTFGQYLAPSVDHYPVEEFITPEQFVRYRDVGLGLGFKSVLSGPLVRSSYKAAEVYKEVIHCFSS